MGDRSNIIIQEESGARVYLYGHWMGEEAIRIVGEVLGRGERLSDSSYLARIVFSRMIRNDIESDSGFGISTFEIRAEYPNIVLDPASETAWLEPDGFVTVNSSAVPFEKFAEACAVSSTYEELDNAVWSAQVAI